MDRHVHHDNAVLQEKVNYLQRLVDKMTTTNRSLQKQLKHRKRPKTKSPGQEGESSKSNPHPPSRVQLCSVIHFCLQRDLQILRRGGNVGFVF
jgi:hypothetical protein